MTFVQPVIAAHPRAQRAIGAVRISAHADEGRSRLDRLFQDGSAKARFPRTIDGALEVALINTAGGMTGGDRFSWAVDVGQDARCQVVTQACEKVYRSTGDMAGVDVSLTVAAGAVLEWLPQETILFEDSQLMRRFDVRVEPGGALLMVEGVILGRKAMGEISIRAALHDRWRVRRGDRLIFTDNLKLETPVSSAPRAALLGEAAAFASVLLVSDDAETRLDAVRHALGAGGGASAFDGKLFCRLLAADGLELRRKLNATMSALRNGRQSPRLWMV
jgi:urease accessory protein